MQRRRRTWCGRALAIACIAMVSACADTVDDAAGSIDDAATTEPAPTTTTEESTMPATTPPTPDEPRAPDGGAATTDTADATDTTPPSSEPARMASPSTTLQTPPSEPSACRRVADFDDDDSWSIVNDGVMGGRSLGSATASSSVLRFEGTVVTDGGGFTSVRRQLGGGELTGSDRLDMRIRADDRVYGIVLDDLHRANGRNVSYRADIDTANTTNTDDGWAIVSVSYADLVPTIFGRVIDAPPFRADEATEIGIIIADGRDGDFSLDVDWIDACGQRS